MAVLTGTAACGVQSLEPKLELRDAFGSFSSARSHAVRLSLGSSLAEVKKFVAEADREDSSGQGPGTSDADLRRLISSRIEVGYDGGADPKKSADDSARVLVRVGDADAGELRTVGQMLYARVAVPALEKQFPDMKDGVESFRGQLAGGDGSDPAPAALRTPATALLDGRWVSLDDRSGSWLDKQLHTAAGGDGSSAPAGGVAEDAPAKLKSLVGKAFDGSVKVERLDGDDKLGDHLRATVNLRAAYGKIRADLPGLLSGSAATDLDKQLPAADDVPDRGLAVSFWVKDGKLTRVDLDLAQILDKPAGHLVLRADTLPTSRIPAPAGAVGIDPQAIADQTGMSLDELMNGPKEDAHTIAGYVDQDIRGLAGAAGAAPSLRYLPQTKEDMAGSFDGVAIAPVGKRIQVTFGGTSACLTLAPRKDVAGTVVDGPC
jgi:hypothetical protein